jgi:hypothetical protein
MHRQIFENMQIIGVTGHRDLDETDWPALKQIVNACMTEIELIQPAGKWCLITGLAAGADQLVAECALERGWTLHAVLASPEESFASTMSTLDAYKLRNDLLPKCAEVTIVTDTEAEEGSEYVAVACLIVERSETLIALWDGMASRGAGGTADTLTRYLEAKPTKFSQRKLKKTVYWVRTRRRGQPAVQFGPTRKKIEIQA